DRVSTLESERDVLKNDLDNTRLELTKVRVALASNVSGEDALEFARLLQGETEEELTEHAEKVKKLMNSASNVGAYDRYQGYGKSKSADPQSDFGAFLMNQLKREGTDQKMATLNEVEPNEAPVNGQGGDHQGRLAHLPSDLLPKEIVGPVFEKAQ